MLLTVVLAIYRLGSYASDQLFVVAVGSCALDHRNQRQNCTYRECNRDCHDDDVRSDIRKAETEQDAVLEQKQHSQHAERNDKTERSQGSGCFRKSLFVRVTHFSLTP